MKDSVYYGALGCRDEMGIQTSELKMDSSVNRILLLSCLLF